MQVPYATVGGADPDGAPQPKSNSGWGPVVTMIVVGVLLLLGYFGYRVADYYLSHPSPYSVRRAATSTDTSVVFPRRIGALTRMDHGFDAQRRAMNASMPSGLQARVAAYSKSGGMAAVVAAGSIRMSSVGEKAFLEGLVISTKKAGGQMAAVDPGPMGGLMSCGTVPVYSETWSTCAYVDHGAFGLVFLSDRGSTARKEVLAIRAAVEHRLS